MRLTNEKRRGGHSAIPIAKRAKFIDQEIDLLILGSSEERLDVENAFSFISKNTESYTNLLEKVKVITNLIIKPNNFNLLLNSSLRPTKMLKNVMISSDELEDFRYTSIQTRYDDIENYSVLAQRKGGVNYDRLPLWAIAGFTLRKDFVIGKLWKNKVEIRAIGKEGKEINLKYCFTTIK